MKEKIGLVAFWKNYDRKQFLKAVQLADGYNKPVVVDFRVDAFEKVYPMVPAGGSNDDIILGPEGDADAKAKGSAPS